MDFRAARRRLKRLVRTTRRLKDHARETDANFTIAKTRIEDLESDMETAKTIVMDHETRITALE